ncbi:heterokaryon incompatibility protein-domain-containing protein [Xylariales sp. AK1849]|nr:heterokaryon incompatibility protein-domain-containing protein [Xylariales sp. AK1849]
MPRAIWADAVCINQKDTKEKELQIPLMGKIYSQASTVLIWLGDEDEDTKDAIDCVKDLCDRLRPRSNEFMDWKRDAITIDEINEMKRQGAPKSNFVRDPRYINRHFGIKPAEHPGYKSLITLLKRPWFARAWTFQESWLATERRLYCGSYSLGPNDLLFAQRVLFKLNFLTEDKRYDFQPAYGMLEGRDFWKHSPKDTIMSLLVFRRGSGCQKPQDLIYSILASVRDTIGIKPNYSLDWPEVFADYTFKEIEYSGDLSILGQIQGIDTIMSIEPKPGDTNSWMTGLLDLGKDSLYERTAETVNTLISRTRCADLALYDEQRTNLRWDTDAVERINYLAEQERGSLYTAYLKRTIARNRGLSLFVTQDQLIGSAPCTISDGDIICVLLGGEVPVVLRPTVEDAKYEFIGECYLHGFMDGESLVEERARTDPSYDRSDKGWLDNLHLDMSPITPSNFRII